MKKLLSFTMLVALAAGAPLAQAQQRGDWQIGAGWLHFQPQDSSEPLTFTAPVRSVVPGSGADVSNADTLGLSAMYWFDSHWAVEGVFGIPPKFKLEGTGTLARIGQLGEARQWSPTLLAKYYFREGTDTWRPFVGAGATYIWYSDVNLTSNLQGALATQIGQSPFGTSTTASIDSGFAPVLHAGVAYQIDPHWSLSLALTYIPIKTTAKLTTRAANGLTLATSESRLKLNPLVTSLFLNYRF